MLFILEFMVFVKVCIPNLFDAGLVVCWAPMGIRSCGGVVRSLGVPAKPAAASVGPKKNGEGHSPEGRRGVPLGIR